MQKTLYDNGFYNMVNVTATDSANEIVPYILKIISPKSVCDVGCGQGAWLEVFRRLGGIEDFIGFDGNYVNKESLLFEDKERFIPTNLEHLPLTYHRTFDLAISLEVAEHISKQNEVLFIESLTRLAPVVLFSAAIPYQKGKNHVNCNYPEHWRQIFASFGYVPIDCIRSQFWDNENVTWWYSQNSFLYIAEKNLNKYPKLPPPPPLDKHILTFVHPQHFEPYVRHVQKPLIKRLINKVKRFFTS